MRLSAARPQWKGAYFVLGGLSTGLVALLVFEERPHTLAVVALLTIVAAGVSSLALLRGIEARASAAAGLLDHSRRTEAALRERARATLAWQRAADQAHGTSEAQLRAARDSAEAIARSRSQFLANMTHEIRTPLNGIIGMTELALESAVTPEQYEYLAVVLSSARGLLAVVDDVLDFSEIERGNVRLDVAPFALDAIVEFAIAPLRPSARRKGIAVVIETHPAVPRHFVGDGRRMGQVIGHLVGNAIKFTEEGSITVRVGLLHCDAGHATLLVAVEDTGVGIPAEKHALVFEAFTQADGSATRRYGGNGLGLALSREKVGLLGGRLWLESEPGRGTVFFFTAPLAIGLAPAGETAAPVRLAGALERALTSPPARRASAALDVLLAEDSDVNQELVRQILERRGHRITVVGDGEEAVRAVAHGSFDVVLMDVQMPVLDGPSATRRIRLAEAPGARVPILALTAYSHDHDATFRAAGMDGYLAKPFTKEELLSAVESAAGLPGDRRSIDHESFLARVGGDASLVREIAETFRADVPRQLAGLASAIESGSGEKMERAAHSLKGACAVVGAREATRLAGLLEHAGSSGAPERAAAIFAALQAELTAALAELGGISPAGLGAR